jgi:hypothetical protein
MKLTIYHHDPDVLIELAQYLAQAYRPCVVLSWSPRPTVTRGLRHPSLPSPPPTRSPVHAWTANPTRGPMSTTTFKNFGRSINDITRDPAKSAKMLDVSEAAYQHASIAHPTFVSPRLWSALGGGMLRVGDLRLQDLTQMASFALAGLTRISGEYRPFAIVLKFYYGANASRIHPELVVAAVVHRPMAGKRQLLLFLGEEV